MNTTAGICSISVRYCASRFGASPSCSGTFCGGIRRIRKHLCQPQQNLLRLLCVQAVEDRIVPVRASHHLCRQPGSLFKRCLREPPQGMNGAAVSRDRIRGEQRPRRLIHERHELVRKPRHGAADTDSADIGTAANTVHPAALAHIALHHRSPAAQLHDALPRAVFLGEFRLLVVAAAVASFVHRLPEKPRGTERLVQRNHGRAPGRLIQQVQQRLGHIVGLRGTTRNAHDGNTGAGFPVPAQIVRQPHGAGRIALHGVNAAVRGAGSGGHHRPGLRRQPVDPVGW